MLVRQDDVTVIAIKDYIKKSKAKTAIRSYHMIIEIPVFFSDSKKADPRRGTDPYHCHGFLGKSGSSVKV